MERIAVSTWAMHAWLGGSFEGSERLAELPGAMADHGFRRVELCHFHLPDDGEDFAFACQRHGVALQTLLIDDGDLTDPGRAEADEAWILGWIERAIALGFGQARVIAGKQPWSVASAQRSADALNRLADRADGRIRLLIENWFDLLQTPEAVHDLIARTGHRVHLNGDFGNWSGPDKYERLARIMGSAVACHAKCETGPDGRVEETDFRRCLRLSEDAGYRGIYTLVHGDGRAEPWALLAEQAQIIAEEAYQSPTEPSE